MTCVTLLLLDFEREKIMYGVSSISGEQNTEYFSALILFFT